MKQASEMIRPLKLSVTAAAAALGQALSALLNERSDLSPEMALRIEVAFGPKADVLMGVQTDWQMARAGAAAGDRGERAAGEGANLLSLKMAKWENHATASCGASALLTAGMTSVAISSSERRARFGSCQSWPA